MKRWYLAVVLMALASAGAAQPPQRMYDAKAAYLLNFLRYVEWPSRPNSGPFVICVVGLEPVHAVLQHTVKGETVEGRPVESRLIQRPSPDCHILFTPNGVDATGYIPATRGTLTVGESPAFLDQGGAIAFVLVDAKLRFRINTDAAARADVRISSRLLRLSYGERSGTR